MKFVLFSALFTLLASTAQAGIFINSPVAKDVWQAGKPQTVTWIDDNKQPALKDLDGVKLELMSGPSNKEISLLTLSENIKGTDMKFEVKDGVPKNLGPSGQFYFLKFSTDTFSAFSARFDIEGINGTIPGFDPSANATAKGTNGTATAAAAGGDSAPAGGSGGYGGAAGNSTGSSTGGSSSSSSSSSSGGSSGGSTTTPSAKPSAAGSAKSTGTNAATAAAAADSLSTVHMATFIVAIIGMVVSNL